MNNKGIKTFLFLLAAVLFMSVVPYSRADSGWDFSYDSGSSWSDSGSSWSDSGSSWSSSDWSSSSSGSRGGSSGGLSSLDRKEAGEAFTFAVFTVSFYILGAYFILAPAKYDEEGIPKKRDFDDTTLLFRNVEREFYRNRYKVDELYKEYKVDSIYVNDLPVADGDVCNVTILVNGSYDSYFNASVYKTGVDSGMKYHIREMDYITRRINNKAEGFKFISLMVIIFYLVLIFNIYSSSNIIPALVLSILVIFVPLILLHKSVKTKVIQEIKDIIPVNEDNTKFDNEEDHLLTDEQIKDRDPSINKDEFIKEAYNLYKDVQIAWMNFDYDKLSKLLTNELFNQYKMLLDNLKREKGKNIMKGITFINGGIQRILKTKKTETIVVYLEVSQKDYVINTETNEVIRGNKDKVNYVKYYITLEKYLEEDSNKCPNCGTEITDEEKCPNCSSVIVRKKNKYVMSKKRLISQR